MINIDNNNIIIKLKDDNLNEAVKAALQTTINLLITYYSADDPNITRQSITSKNKAYLALMKFVSNDAVYNKDWLVAANKIILEEKPQTIRPDTLSSIFPDGNITKTLAMNLLKGLRILFIVLWSKDVVILSLKHSIPVTSRRATEEEREKILKNGSRHGSKGHYVKEDLAADVYSEVMQFVRKPFSNNEKLKSNPIPDLLEYCGETEFVENIHSYVPRILLATDWHSIEDVSTNDLNEMAKHFEGMRRKIKSSEHGNLVFPVSLKSELAYYLKKAYPNRCKFDFELIYHGRSGISIDNLRDEIERLPTDIASTEIKEAWLVLEEEYIHNLRYTKRKKAWKTDENIIAKLNKYLFTILPNKNIKAPFPSEFNRQHLSRNKTDIPSLYNYIKDRDSISTIQRFFDFMFDLGEIKQNPIIDIDKPLERRRSQSNKAKLTITQFRLVLELGYTIESFTWHIAKTIKNNNLNKVLLKKLCDINENRLLSTEEFGYVPILYFKDTRGRSVKLPLKWLPVHLLNVLPLKLKGGSAYVHTPTVGGIHSVLTGLETGLRGIHIRWLERNDLPSKPEGSFFNLVVNTDKAKKTSWIRPTLSRVYNVLEKQVSVQSWYEMPWGKDCFYYDGHEESDYDKIYPVFLNTNSPTAIGDHTLRKSARRLFLMANIIHQGVYGSLMQSKQLKYFDVDDVNLSEEETYNHPNEFWDQLVEHTVHSMRVSVTSAAATILPESIIGKYITGHETEAHVSYYTILDTEFIEDTRAMNRAMLGSKDDYDEVKAYTLAAERKGAALVEAFKNGDATDIIKDFGGFSFSYEKTNGEITSGIQALNENYDIASLEPTHICPFGNNCPQDIIKEGLKRKCGQCWYSVKTIDHLPRILGLCHSLSLKQAGLEKRLEQAADNGATDKVLSTLEVEMQEQATELAAWLVTSEYLTECHKKMKSNISRNDNITLIRKPDLLKSTIELKTSTNGLESLLVMCDEASNYPEFLSVDFELKIKKVRQQILIKTDRIVEALEDYSNQPLIDSFRGVIKSICKFTGLSLNELDAALCDNEIKILSNNPTSLLEKIDD